MDEERGEKQNCDARSFIAKLLITPRLLVRAYAEIRKKLWY